jgi:non-ribosomal peptide synthetase component F
VGLCIERSLAMLVGLLGILKAGGAYLPLDPDYPPERLAFMLADAGAPVLLTRTALRAQLPAHDTSSDEVRSDDARIDAAHIVCLDADWPAIARQPTTAPATGLAPQHPAYVIYTSGSTGTPKGVAVTHSGFPNLAAAHIDRLAITPGARILQFASLSFDAAASEIVTALASGAALVLPVAERSGDALAHLIREQGVTHALLPPVVVADLPESLGLTGLLVGGESCAPDLVRRRRRSARP